MRFSFGTRPGKHRRGLYTLKDLSPPSSYGTCFLSLLPVPLIRSTQRVVLGSVLSLIHPASPRDFLRLGSFMRFNLEGSRVYPTFR